MNARKILGLVLLAVLLSVCILYGDGPDREANDSRTEQTVR